MSRPIVIAYHLIWTAYGWWLPNDPRGSGSRTIASNVLADLGALHYGRKHVQPSGGDVCRFYERATDLLKHSLLKFDTESRDEIAIAFAEVIYDERYTCYACVIMPDHVHLLIRKHKHQAEQMIEKLQNASRLRLHFTGHRPADHPVWTGGGGWKVFLDRPESVRRTIAYIEKNPLSAGLPKQQWSFVKVYDNWPLHPGHNPNSPYTRRLRETGFDPE